ncbi:Lar family restriction alleviation protein [Burkholderia cepacia]|uniref:Lar family restriction alleviation protein n=1 Tax=Burkholderia cepacia TaxID=292 RepID=UPI0009BFE608|nr:Lar family restriction alleviation protein [Burkholderia cepacia]
MPNDNVLKPCPFCGGDVKHIQGLPPLDDSHFIDCPGCGMSSKIASTKEAVIEAWNRRAHPGPPEPRAEVTNPFRELLAALIDIYDDERNNAPEDRCYVEGAWSEVLGEARALLALLPDPAQVAAESPDWIKSALPPEGA